MGCGIRKKQHLHAESECKSEMELVLRNWSEVDKKSRPNHGSDGWRILFQDIGLLGSGLSEIEDAQDNARHRGYRSCQTDGEQRGFRAQTH